MTSIQPLNFSDQIADKARRVDHVLIPRKGKKKTNPAWIVLSSRRSKSCQNRGVVKNFQKQATLKSLTILILNYKRSIPFHLSKKNLWGHSQNHQKQR